MKPVNKRIILYAMATLVGVSVAMSCGQGISRNELGQYGNLDESSPNAMNGIHSQLSENQLTDYVPSSQMAGNTLSGEPSFSQQLDVPRAQANLEPDLNAAPFMNSPSNAITGVPYYCNPAKYPPNITTAAKGCERFQGIPPQGYPTHHIHDYAPGQYNYAYLNNGGAPAGPIGYRVKPFVGTLGTKFERWGRGHDHDDDDSGSRSRNRSFSNGNKFRTSSHGRWSGSNGRWHHNSGSRSNRRHRNDLEKNLDLSPAHPSDAAKEPLFNDASETSDLGPRHPSDAAKRGQINFDVND